MRIDEPNLTKIHFKWVETTKDVFTYFSGFLAMYCCLVKDDFFWLDSQKETIVFQPSMFRCQLLVSGSGKIDAFVRFLVIWWTDSIPRDFHHH